MERGIPGDQTAEPLQFRRAVEASGEVIFMTNREGVFTYVNPAFVALYGHSADALVGRATPRVLKGGQLDAEYYRLFWTRLLAGESFQGEFVNRDKAGRLVEVDTAVSPIFDDGGVLAGFLAIQRDVTARRHTERQLLRRDEAAARETEAKYRTLYAAMREGVALHELLYDSDGRAVDYRLVDVNPAFERQTNIAPARAVGALASELYGGGTAPYLDLYSRVAASGEAVTFEAAFDPMGRIFQVSAFPTGPGRFATLFEDVTDRRHLEEQFRQAQKMEAIGRLAGGIAHDFNNLLTAILGYSELLLGHELPEPAIADVEQIRKAGEAAAALTGQLLTFSRKQILRPELVDLNRIVKDIDAMLRRVIGEDIRLVSIPAPRPARVAADPGQMQQVLLNLAVNARDAMATGGSLIIETANMTVGTDAGYAGAPPPGRYVALIVSDTGTGMSDQVQTRLFEPFFTTKEPGKGTGLGLSTVYGIVKQSGGHIMVQSELGRGTTFRILLPHADEARGQPGPDEPVATTAGTETILVVEDQAPVRALIAKVLTAFGYSVLPAGDADEAETQAARHDGAIDLLITDLQLGRVNGPELAQRLVARRPGLGVLYISGYADHTTMVGVMSSRVAFLHKPFTPEILVRTVRQVLDRSAA